MWNVFWTQRLRERPSLLTLGWVSRLLRSHNVLSGGGVEGGPSHDVTNTGAIRLKGGEGEQKHRYEGGKFQGSYTVVG